MAKLFLRLNGERGYGDPQEVTREPTTTELFTLLSEINTLEYRLGEGDMTHRPRTPRNMSLDEFMALYLDPGIWVELWVERSALTERLLPPPLNPNLFKHIDEIDWGAGAVRWRLNKLFARGGGCTSSLASA